MCRKPKVLNWVGEFEHWLSDSTVPVYEFASQPDWRVRALVLNSWVRNGGVMIVDYDVYRSLTRFDAFVGDRHSNVWIYNVFKEALVKPGPDVVVCDEGQVLSKESSQLFESINRIATKCRIVLTALPLLNSLVEYYTMVEFVKPDWLSSREDFTRKFVDPIEKGVHPDSSNDEVQAMRRRAFVLNDHLSGKGLVINFKVLTHENLNQG